MKVDLIPCTSYALAHEGGYTNNPRDPGGPTNFGITIYDVRKYLDPYATAATVKALTKQQAIAIYERHYWDPMNCDALPAGPDYATYDYGINSGIGRASRVLQRIVGVKDDGQIGPRTLEAVAKHDSAELVDSICDERMRFLKSLSIWGTFGRGWTTRVTEVRTVGIKMARAHGPLITAKKMTLASGKGWVPTPDMLKRATMSESPRFSWDDWEGLQIAPVAHDTTGL